MAQRITHRQQGSGLEYLLGNTKVVFSNGQVATREEFDAWAKAGGDVLTQELRKLEAVPDRNNWDYKYAVSTGDLRRRKPTTKPRGTTRRTKQKEEWQRPERRRFSSALVVEAATLLVGLGGGVMSAYHTATFLAEGGKPAWTAWTTGIIMILFSTTAFTLARLLANKLSFLVAAVGAAVVAFSMFSTVTVNFNQFRERDDERTALAVGSDEALSVRQRALGHSREELDENAAEIGRLEAEASYWQDKSWARHDDFSQLAEEARQRRRELLARRRELEASAPALTEAAASSRSANTVYALLGRLFKAREDAVRFAAYAIPSLFYDLAAPLALSAALFLEDNRRKKEKAAYYDGHGG
jgi:hypothetical protein